MFKISRRDTCDRYYIFSLFGFAIFVHYLKKSETEGIFHSHPWNGISLIFGEYWEQHRYEAPKRKRLINYVSATTHHRIAIDKPVWTIFFHFRRSNLWEVRLENGTLLEVEPWRGDRNSERTSYAIHD